MLKKIAIFFVALSYLFLVSGVVINTHYCMTQVADISFYGDKKEECGRCGMKMHDDNSCCHDDVEFKKIDDDHQQGLSLVLSPMQWEFIPSFVSSFILADLQIERPVQHFINHSPPLLSESDTYLQNNVFRI